MGTVKDSDVSSLPDRGDDVHFSVEHRLRMAIRPGGKPEIPWFRRVVKRDLVYIAALVAVGALLVPFASTPNPDYPEAVEVADRLNSTWWTIVDEGSDPETAAEANGLAIHSFQIGDRTRLVLTGSEPTSAGICYAQRFGEGLVTEGGVLLDPGPGCTPQPPGQFAVRGAWADVLPSEQITAVWFVPAVVVLVALAVAAAVSISIALLAKPLAPTRGRWSITRQLGR